MAEGKKKRKLWYEKTALAVVKAAVVSVEEKTSSNWHPGKGSTEKPAPRRMRKSATDRSAVIVQCGGETRGHIKRHDGVGPDGLKVFKVRQCVSEYQDRIHGKNMRVANSAEAKGAKKGVYRCTVCTKEHKVT